MSAKSFSLASRTVQKFADRLARMKNGEKTLQRIVVKITLLTKEAIIDKITNEIDPHNRDGKTVTDLVDTGFYRASWQESFPRPYTGKVATTAEYALPLEIGTEHMPGFYVARDTARKMRKEFVRELRKALKESTQ